MQLLCIRLVRVGFLVGFQFYAYAPGSVSLGLYHVNGSTFIPKQLWYQLPVPASGSNTVRDIGKHVSLIDIKLCNYIHILDYLRVSYTELDILFK